MKYNQLVAISQETHIAVATQQFLAATVTMFYQIHAACSTGICASVSINLVAVPLRGMKTYRAMEIQRHRFLSYEVYGDEWSLSRLGCFTHGKYPPPLPRNQFYKGRCGIQGKSVPFGQKVNLLACCKSSRHFSDVLSLVCSLFSFVISAGTRSCLLLQAYLFACYKTIFKI